MSVDLPLHMSACDAASSWSDATMKTRRLAVNRRCSVSSCAQRDDALRLYNSRWLRPAGAAAGGGARPHSVRRHTAHQHHCCNDAAAAADTEQQQQQQQQQHVMAPRSNHCTRPADHSRRRKRPTERRKSFIIAIRGMITLADGSNGGL